MSQKPIRLFIVCFTLYVTAGYNFRTHAQRAAGDQCRLGNGGLGTCVLPKDCPGLKQKIQAQMSPPVCSFVGVTPIVCCEAERPSTKYCKKYRRKPTNVAGPLLPDSTGFIREQSNDCSVTNSPFITGGTNASVAEFPHMVAIGYRSSDSPDEIEWNCGGTLISNYYVLTAAHCLRTAPDIVRVGDLDLRNDREVFHRDIPVAQVILHPNYERPYNDIGLIRMSDDALDYDYYNIIPACLSFTDNVPEVMVATGWGRLSAFGEKSPILQKVSLKLISNEDCALANDEYPRGIVAGMVCAGDQLDQDACSGDSGGPLQYFNSSLCSHEIIGVTSGGSYCGYGVPGIYSRVSYYLDWIESIVWPNTN